MRVRAIIQARMGSQRLRGKTLSPIDDIVLLKRVYDSVMQLELADDIFVATSDLSEDNEIENFCSNKLQCGCIRGSSENVLSRFIVGSEDLNEKDILMRITADNIFYQESICKQLLHLHKLNDADYTGILGLSHIACELISVGAIQKLEDESLTNYDTEHVTPFLINNPEKFRINLVDRKDFGLQKELDTLLTVDDVEDRERIESLIKYFRNNKLDYSQDNLYNWLKENTLKLD